MNGDKVKVWDSVVRGFHWLLVFAFIVAFATEDDWITLHSWAGYLVIGLLLLRLFWGFVGSSHARFSDFSFSMSQVLSYLRDVFLFKAKRYIGHNPAGAWMIYMLFVCLALTSVTGLVVLAIEEQAGPLAPYFLFSDERLEDVIEELHEFFANFTLVLVCFHVAGVVFESVLHKENLVKAMIDGYKKKASR